MLMLQVRQLTIASHPLHYFWKARHPYIALLFFKCFWAIILSSFLLIKLYPCNYLSRECGLYKARYLLLGDHLCEKSNAVNWIDCT